jgi:ribosomal protein S18 acetylase RimI-like enzyme
MTIRNADAVSFSEVDSQRFGVRIARACLTAGGLPRVLEFCAAEKIDLLIARCSTRDLGTVQEMEAAGFQIMDTLVYYQLDVANGPIPSYNSCARIRSFTAEDTAQIEKIAAAAFAGYSGHYHADTRLDRSKCDEGYVSWAVRSCTSKQVADEVLVAELDGRVIGFATLRWNCTTEGEILLFGIAPEAQRRGIGRSLLQTAAERSCRRAVRKLIISTQLTNISAQTMWCRAGFEPCHSYYTFHKWFSR